MTPSTTTTTKPATPVLSINAADFTQIRPVAAELIERSISDVDAFERWLLDRSDLEAAIDNKAADLYINNACHTNDPDIRKAYLDFIEAVPPKYKPLAFQLDRKQVELFERFAQQINTDRYNVLKRSKTNAVSLFREENVPIETELDKLEQEHGRISGEQTVIFEGQELTLQQMAPYLEKTDRNLREQAWRTIADRRLKDREELDNLLTTMVGHRHKIATNAGFPSYVEYTFKRKERFDYTPEHCHDFWDACEKHVVPLMRKLDAERAQTMGLSKLRPWDLAVDPKGRPPLQPFKGGRDLVEKTAAVFSSMDKRLGELFSRMTTGLDQSPDGTALTPMLDLDSRKGKRPGGFQYGRAVTREPFIFMNAAGLQRDVMTMVHEAGHAFHSMLAANEPLLDYWHSPIEFAEVASMSMEHLSMPYWGGPTGFYTDEQQLARARREHLESAVNILAWIATIDAFQHWMYNNPNHTAEQRYQHWLELDARFGHDIDWSGLEDHRKAAWQRQPHLYGAPMYYIEYGIAQLGALGLWLRSKRESEKTAIDAYINALTIGGAKPLPELFNAAGLPFDFGDKTVQSISEAVQQELATLPA